MEVEEQRPGARDGRNVEASGNGSLAGWNPKLDDLGYALGRDLLLDRVALEPWGNVLLGRIRDVAARGELDIGGLEIVDAAHSHEAAAKAVELVRLGRAEALMKGSLHTDELMGAAVSREGGIRTARRWAARAALRSWRRQWLI